jgi:hypothetical protein
LTRIVRHSLNLAVDQIRQYHSRSALVAGLDGAGYRAADRITALVANPNVNSSDLFAAANRNLTRRPAG